MPAPRFVLDDFWPSDLFLGGIPGAWYDPTDPSTMFQDSTGTTPVTAVEQPVGLILDKSQGVAVGATIVTNGDFSAGTTGWLAGNSATLTSPASDLRMVGNGATTYPQAYQPLTSTSGRWYRATVTLKSANTSVTLILRNGPWGAPSSQAFNVIGSTPGTYSVYLYGTGASMAVGVEPTTGLSSADITIDDMSVVPIAGNHASQSTAASRPTYRARYNLLTFSEQFDNAAWNKVNASVTTNATTAPDGTNTADALIEDGTTNNHLTEIFVGAAAALNTYSIYVKPKDGRNYVLLYAYGAGFSGGRYFDLTGSGAILGAQGTAPASASITPAANGFFRVSITFNGAITNVQIYTSDNGSRFSGWAGNGQTGLFLWGAQVMTAADVTATGNAYQRIAASTVYDTAPVFRPYLAFDGVDDSLSTAAINFTSTARMTAFVGVTKNTDAGGYGTIVELSPGNGVGSFAIFQSPTTVASNAAYEFFQYLVSGCGFDPSVYAAPITNVVTSSFAFAGATVAQQIIPRINGVTNQTNQVGSAQPAGTFGNYPLYIGRRGGASLPMNGRLYSLIVRGAASSVTEIADTELWVNARTGAF